MSSQENHKKKLPLKKYAAGGIVAFLIIAAGGGYYILSQAEENIRKNITYCHRQSQRRNDKTTDGNDQSCIKLN